MALTVFKSTDASAPVLTGQVGTVPALLDACLVSGYGAKSALGWSKPYTGTNGAVFRAPSGNRHYVLVADNATDSSGAKVANAIGYETMSAYSVGTGLFPTAAQLANGVFIIKSSTADATARPWTLIGDDKTFYLIIAATSSATWNGTHPFCFGEIYTYKSGDAYHSFIAGDAATSTNGFNTTHAFLTTVALGGTAASAAGYYAARSYTQTGTSQALYNVGPMNTAVVLGTTGITYPNAVDGGAYVAPIPVGEALTGGPIRGILRGVFTTLHANPFANYDTVSNPTGLGSITLMAVLAVPNAGTAGVLLFDTTGPWL